MALGWSKSTVSPIAIDFGADSLKLLQVVPGSGGGGGRPRLVAAASAVMPDSARCDASQRFGFYSQALKLLLKSQKFKGKRAICSVPAYQTLVHHLQIPRAEANDDATILDHIGLQLRQRLNVDPTRVVIRYFDVGPIVRDGVPKQEFICVAVSQDVVMRYLAIAESAKLQVVGMHCEQYAIMRAFGHLDQDATSRRENKATCFIDFGSMTTKLVITRSIESPESGVATSGMGMAKTIHAGGDHLTRHHAKQAGLSFADARASRIRQACGLESHAANTAPQAQEVPQGLAAAAMRVETEAMAMSGSTQNHGDLSSRSLGDAGGHAGTTQATMSGHADHTALGGGNSGGVAGGTAGGNADGKVGGTVGANVGSGDMWGGETVECIIDELRMSVRYYQSLFPENAIDRLVFLGGESRHTKLCQQIARALRIGAQLGDPMANLHGASNRQGTGVDMTQPQPGWAVPFGLCLSEKNL